MRQKGVPRGRSASANGAELPMRESVELSETERLRAQDLEWARTAPDVQRHQGKLVVVHHQRVVAVGTDRAALLQQAAAEVGRPEHELAVVVVHRGGLAEFPH